MKQTNKMLAASVSPTLIMLIILGVVLVVMIGLMVWLTIKRRKTNNGIQQTKNETNIGSVELTKLAEQYQKANKVLQDKIDLLNSKLADVNHLTKDEAKQLLINNFNQEMDLFVTKSINKAHDEIQLKSSEYAQSVLLEVMESLAENVATEYSTVTIALKDDSLKGRIIGREGRNKKVFEQLLGIDLVIEKTPEITISTPNPIRRELAKIVIEKILIAKNIDPIRIQKVYEEESKIFEDRLIDYGRKAIENELKMYDMDHKIYPYIGRLHFRTSYGQNVLSHMIECAKVSQMIAMKLGLDANIAKSVGFFHDIGKAIDFETDYDHVVQGVKLAKQFNLDDYIIDAIKSHHNGEINRFIYSSIVKVADTLSAARPGARIDSYEEYIQRVTTMEELCLKHKGVNKAYALKAGRYLTIFVEPSIINEINYRTLAYKIKTDLEANDITNKFQIEVQINRYETINLKTEVRQKEKKRL